MSYKPRQSDIDWTSNLLSALSIGGMWCIPATGQVLKKTGEKELTLVSGSELTTIEDQEDMLMMLEANLKALGGSLRYG